MFSDEKRKNVACKKGGGRMESLYEFEDVNLSSRTIDEVTESIIKVIKKELPEEAQSYDVISFILDNTLNKLRSKRIEL